MESFRHWADNCENYYAEHKALSMDTAGVIGAILNKPSEGARNNCMIFNEVLSSEYDKFLESFKEARKGKAGRKGNVQLQFLMAVIAEQFYPEVYRKFLENSYSFPDGSGFNASQSAGIYHALNAFMGVGQKKAEKCGLIQFYAERYPAYGFELCSALQIKSRYTLFASLDDLNRLIMELNANYTAGVSGVLRNFGFYIRNVSDLCNAYAIMHGYDRAKTSELIEKACDLIKAQSGRKPRENATLTRQVAVDFKKFLKGEDKSDEEAFLAAVGKERERLFLPDEIVETFSNKKYAEEFNKLSACYKGVLKKFDKLKAERVSSYLENWRARIKDSIIKSADGGGTVEDYGAKYNALLEKLKESADLKAAEECFERAEKLMSENSKLFITRRKIMPHWSSVKELYMGFNYDDWEDSYQTERDFVTRLKEMDADFLEKTGWLEEDGQSFFSSAKSGLRGYILDRLNIRPHKEERCSVGRQDELSDMLNDAFRCRFIAILMKNLSESEGETECANARSAITYINGKLSKAFYREINEYDCHDIFDWFVVCCIRREEEYATEHPEEYEDWNANISGWNMFCDFMSGKAQYEERYL